MASVRVAVRVRPLNKREKKLSSKVVVQVKDNTTSLLHNQLSSIQGDGLKDGAKTFSYDFSYDSTDENSPDFTSQEKIFRDLGLDVLQAAFQGFNACVFAYGQTGSGKSYTMMGHAGDKGLIPRICEGLFCEISARNEGDCRSFHTEVSYLEIYNERVLDLLNKRPSSAPKGGLRVREHPTDGPYVENLSRHVVHSYGDVKELMATGNANRTTASTGMNDASSRSHAMFTIKFTQAQFDSELPCETQSKLHLVDLAGSERADSTRATGTRLKEGASINKSLVTLGSVISALADMSDKLATKRQTFIPYRDSVLTWLLKDSLGGNSKTIMIATVSPADVNYGETLSTLRYASRAKSIVNSPAVNEDSGVRVIRQLREEIARLRALLDRAGPEVPLPNSPAAEERLQQRETKVLELTKEWTNKWWETENILKEETLALRKQGGGVVLDSQLPHLIAVDLDLLGTSVVIYHLKEGRTLVGRDEASDPQGVAVPGPRGEGFVFENLGGAVSLVPPGGGVPCSVDGVEVMRPCRLNQGATVQLGPAGVFRFNHPAEAARLRCERQNGQLTSSSLSVTDQSGNGNPAQMMLPQPRPDVSAAAGVDPLPPPPPLSKPPVDPSAEVLHAAAMPGSRPVPHSSSSGPAGAGGGCREREGGPSRKSGPDAASAPPNPSGDDGRGTGAAAAARRGGGGEGRSGGVPSPGDGCGAPPVGSANESRGVAAESCQGRPGSAGSSLEGAEQRLRRSGPGSVPPRASARSPPRLENTRRRAPERAAPEARPGGECDVQRGGPEAGEPEVSGRRSRLGSLVNRVSWMFPDAGRLLRRLPGLHRARETRWSSQAASFIRGSQVLNAVTTSQMFSLITESYAFSLVRDSRALSAVSGLPLIQRLQLDPSPAPQTAGEQEPEAARLPTQSGGDAWPRNSSSVEESGLCGGAGELEMNTLETVNIQAEEEEWSADEEEASPAPPSCKSQATLMTAVEEPAAAAAAQNSIITAESPEDTVTVRGTEGVQTICQNLLQFPDVFKELQSLPLPELVMSLRHLVPSPVFSSQPIVALYWLEAATCHRPRPRPALVLLQEAGLHVLACDAGALALFHHFPMRLLQEIHVGLAGQSLRLTGGAHAEEEMALDLHTHSWRLTQEVSRTLLGVLRPGDGHPLLHADMASTSLDWHAPVPDLLLGAGLKVTCRFQRPLADLAYLLHANMPSGGRSVADVRVLLYTSVGVCTGPCARAQPLARLLLTETHLGLVQEDPLFRGKPRRSHFLDLWLRPCADVRQLLLRRRRRRAAEGRAGPRVDVVLAGSSEGAGGRGAPEAPKSAPRAEVWKLTFSCAAEAACLMDHLSSDRFVIVLDQTAG